MLSTRDYMVHTMADTLSEDRGAPPFPAGKDARRAKRSRPRGPNTFILSSALFITICMKRCAESSRAIPAYRLFPLDMIAGMF